MDMRMVMAMASPRRAMVRARTLLCRQLLMNMNKGGVMKTPRRPPSPTPNHRRHKTFWLAVRSKQGKIGRSYAHYPLAGLASAEDDVHTKVYT